MSSSSSGHRLQKSFKLLRSRLIIRVRAGSHRKKGNNVVVNGKKRRFLCFEKLSPS
jgi:hypothetical protein